MNSIVLFSKFQLKLDLEEIEKLLDGAQRENVKKILDQEVQRLRKAIQQAEAIQSRLKAEGGVSAPKRYVSELTNYAWDQSDKFVKLFVTLDGIQNIENPDANVTISFTANSLQLKVSNFQNRDYVFVVNNLLSNIVPDASYQKVKTDMVYIYLKKQKEGAKWTYLTSTEKQLKELKQLKTAASEDTATDPSDPTSSLMSMMKKMYQEGDPEMKRMIAKSWQESTDKRNSGLDNLDL